jgi:CubicO group peptidase (beta-lactamase class C family)
MVELAVRQVSDGMDLKTATVDVPVHIAESGEFAADDSLRAAQERLWSCVLRLYETGLYPGISVCVLQEHQPLLHRAIGYAQVAQPAGSSGVVPPMVLPADTWLEAGGEPMRPEQPACLFSASKMVTAMLVHHLVAVGEISMTDPLAAVLPELKGAQIGQLNMLDVLSHRAGVPSFPKHLPIDVLFDNDAALEALKMVEPQMPSESAAAYHAVTGGVLAGAVIERVTGHSPANLLDSLLRAPLGTSFFSFGLDEKYAGAYVHEYMTGDKPNLFLQQWASRLVGASLQEAVRITRDPRFRKSIIPAANMYATAEEMCRFLQVLSQHGRFGAQSLFSTQTIANALRPVGGWCFDRQFMLPMRYSAGFMLGANPVGLWGPLSERSFGHLGFTNKWCWANPQSQTQVCLLSNGNCLAGAPIKAMIQFVVEIQRLGGVFSV